MKNLKNFEKINPSEYFLLQREINQCHSLYQALYQLSNLYFSNSVKTAAVTYDKQGNMLDMIINKDFWNSLSFEGKKFVILHELSHIIYDHGKRTILLELDPTISNYAQDIFINHHLHRNYNVDRELFNWKDYCWVETLFPDENVSSNEAFEFYYNKLIQNKNADLSKVMLIGSHGNGETNNQDEPNVEKKQGKQKLEEDILDEILSQNPEIKSDVDNFDDFKIQKNKTKPSEAPKENENSTRKGQVHTVETKKNHDSDYDKFMKELIPDKKKNQTKYHDTWSKTNRRYIDFLDSNKDMFLPATIEDEPKKKKKSVWIFTDTSGSCHGMIPVFAQLIKDISEHAEVSECRAFCFGDDCNEITISKNKPLDIIYESGNDGGLSCIEKKIRQIMAQEKIPHPDNVVVLTDGVLEFSLKNSLTNPKSWYMLINSVPLLNKHIPPGGRGKYFDEYTFMNKTNTTNNYNTYKRRF